MITRLVPKYADDEDAYNVSQTHGWEPTEHFGEDLQQWTLPGADAKVTWFWDASTSVQQFAIEGSDTPLAVAQIEAAVDILHADDFEAYLARFTGARGGLMKGLNSIGVVAAGEQPTTAVIELLRRYQAHPDQSVRDAALAAAQLVGWSELARPIRLVPLEQDAFEATLALVEEGGWEELPDDPAAWSIPEGAVVRARTDGITGVEYFDVEGPGREAVARRIADRIDMLEPEGFEAFLARFHSDQGVRDGLYAVATAAPAISDPDVVALLARYLEHEDPLTRRTALVAVSITGWPAFIPAVERVRDHDADERVRSGAESAVRALHG